MRQTEGELVRTLLNYVDRCYGREAVDEAWDEFTLGSGAPMDPDSEPELDTVFLPWLLFTWAPEDAAAARGDSWDEWPVAMRYLHEEGAHLDSFQKRFIEEVCSQPFSFFVVTGVIRGESLRLRDLFLQREVTVHERRASRVLREGSVIFARIAILDDTAIMTGCAPMEIPPRYLNALIDIRERMTKKRNLVPQDLLALDAEMRGLYYDIRDELSNPQPLELRNTDGEPLELTTLHYELTCSPQETVVALAALAMEEPVEIARTGEFDEHGNLRSVEFSWLKKGNKLHASWENTALGQITIDGSHMTVDVNSRKRAKIVKREIKKRLGRKAVLKDTVVHSMEEMLDEVRKRPPTEKGSEEDLMALPEVQAKIKEMAAKHWAEWLDTELPALKGQTPREAARTPIGRERLEALLWEFEQRTSSPQPFHPDVPALRRSLGLD